MIRELFTIEGKRKYLDQAEQGRFLATAALLDRAEVRTHDARLYGLPNQRGASADR